MEPSESLMRRIANPSRKVGVRFKSGYDLVHARFDIKHLRGAPALLAELG